MSGTAWSPVRVPDVADPSYSASSGGGAGVTISPSGIASLETFGSATISSSSALTDDLGNALTDDLSNGLVTG